MLVRVTYLVTLGEPVVGMGTAVPAGSLVMVLEDGDWKVERIVLRPGGSAGGGPRGGGAQHEGDGHRS